MLHDSTSYGHCNVKPIVWCQSLHSAWQRIAGLFNYISRLNANRADINRAARIHNMYATFRTCMCGGGEVDLAWRLIVAIPSICTLFVRALNDGCCGC
jgi:hypothetical protein